VSVITLSMNGQNGAIPRLRRIDWQALRADLAVPAIAGVLGGAAAEREVDRALRAHRGLSREERRALAEAIFGVALWRRRLAWEADLAEATPGAAAALLACLLRDLADVPAGRAAVLAGSPPLRPKRSRRPERLADRWSLPDWLASHLLEELGPAEAEAFCEAVAVPGPICLRANRLLCTREALRQRLAAEGTATVPARLAPDALIVTSPTPNLFGSQAWRDGWFEPQDEGSQLLGLLVEPSPGDSVLDLCAGAGGKSLLLAAQGARVGAFDSDRGRLARLRTRARRAHAGIAILASPEPADHVLVDAPCSELGALRRGPDLRWRIDPATLRTLPALQREILDGAAPLARRRLVYGTCTLARAENEDLAAAFESSHPELRRTRTFRTLPHRDGTDGFFGVVWERR
jgi:16S rRNA (cytosine967-C5)-methyltransferase